MKCAPCWYVAVATIVTCYQGYRGFMFQSILAKSDWTSKQKLVLLCIADAILYVVCTATGFLALWGAYLLAVQVPSFLTVSAGTSVLLAVLALVGILGVTGQLPHLLQQGKLLPPWIGGEK